MELEEEREKDMKSEIESVEQSITMLEEMVKTSQDHKMCSVEGGNFGLLAQILEIYPCKTILQMTSWIFTSGWKPQNELKDLPHFILIKSPL